MKHRISVSEKKAKRNKRDADPLGNGKPGVNTAYRIIPEKFKDKADDSVSNQIKSQNPSRDALFSPIKDQSGKQNGNTYRFCKLNRK